MSVWTAEALSDWLTSTLLPGWLARIYDPTRPGFVEMLEPGGTASDSDHPQHAGDGAPESTLSATRICSACPVRLTRHATAWPSSGRLADAPMAASAIAARERRGRRCPVRFLRPRLRPVLARLVRKASGEAEAFSRADTVMGFIETQLAHPEGGFARIRWAPCRAGRTRICTCSKPATLWPRPRRHRWLAARRRHRRADAQSMLDEATDSLGEFFSEDWSAARPRGLVREPGHHYEWTWLLYHHERLTGSVDARASDRQLFDFADKRHRGGAVVNEIDPQGAMLNGSALLWPQTEYLKALAARVEFEGDADAMRRLDAIWT
jgi:hypothetical protein